MGLVAWRFLLWLLLRGHSLGHVHSFSDCQEWSWYYLWALLPRSYPWVRVTYYCSVSVWLQVVLKPLVPVSLLPCVDGSVCSLGNAFKSAPHPALIAPEWVQPCTCTLPSWSSQLIMMPGGLFWADSFSGSFFKTSGCSAGLMHYGATSLLSMALHQDLFCTSLGMEFYTPYYK